MKKFNIVYSLCIIILLAVLVFSLTDIKKDIKVIKKAQTETNIRLDIRLETYNKILIKNNWYLSRLETYILSIYDKDARWLVKLFEKDKNR